MAEILEKAVLHRGNLPAQNCENLNGTSCFYTRFPGKERLTPVADFCRPERPKGGHLRYQTDFHRMKEVRA